jgi:DNA-binding NarL/FixJ family response regulator
VRATPDNSTCETVRALFLRTPPLPLAEIAERARLPLDRIRRIIDELALSRTRPRRNRKLSPAEQAALRQLRREGCALASIAAQLGISESHAARLAKRLDAARPSLKRVLTDAEKQQLKALDTEGNGVQLSREAVD